MICTTGDSGSRSVSVRVRSADELLVPTGLPADAGTVLATCSILRSILRAADPVHEQHEDARSRCGHLAAGPSDRRTADSERAFATRPTADYGNIHHATPIPYAMKLMIATGVS